MRVFCHPDSVLRTSDCEPVAVDLLAVVQIPGVETWGLDSGITRRTLLQAAVDQTSSTAVADTIRGMYSDAYTPDQLHTAPPDDLEAGINDFSPSRRR